MRHLPDFASTSFLNDYWRVSQQLEQMNSMPSWSALRAAERALKSNSTFRFPSSEALRQVSELQRAMQPLYEWNRVLAQARDLSGLGRIRHEHSLGSLAALTTASFAVPLHVQDLTRHAAWVQEITSQVSKIDFRPVVSRLEAGWGEYRTLGEGLLNAFRDIEFPSEIIDGPSAEALFEELAAEVERASIEPEGLGIGAAIAHVLSRLTGLDERQRGYLFVMLLLVVITFGQESIGAIVEVEYDRWRNAPENPEQMHQIEAFEASRRELEDLARRISHPPMMAEVVRSARLRVTPDTGASIVRTLGPGTHLVVLERQDGWVRVEAEPAPGEVFEGWVYGRLTKYIH